MKTIVIESLPGFEEWRRQARECLLQKIPPSDLKWQNKQGVQVDMFEAEQAHNSAPALNIKFLKIPKMFLSLAETAACHNDPVKYDLLYRILWRQIFENKKLLKLSTDNDVLILNEMVKAVRRDAYKITAFLRFREVRHENEEYFIAWYEPEHYTLERVLPFFQTRFRNMRWSILTPYRAAHWDKESMICEDNPDPNRYPKSDEVEKYWLGYYASIFNPARPKKSAMLNQMPKKYWKMMPETVLIPDLLRTANARTYGMMAAEDLEE